MIEDTFLAERYGLVKYRIKEMLAEPMPHTYREYLTKLAVFLLQVDETPELAVIQYQKEVADWRNCFLSGEYCLHSFPAEVGLVLAVVYATIHNAAALDEEEWRCVYMELFAEIYALLQDDVVSADSIKDSIYWFHCDYAGLLVKWQVSQWNQKRMLSPLACLNPALIQQPLGAAKQKAYRLEHREDAALYMGAHFKERLLQAYRQVMPIENGIEVLSYQSVLCSEEEPLPLVRFNRHQRTIGQELLDEISILLTN